MKHIMITKCEDDCGCCNVCCLGYCQVCGEFEAGLTTECCGRVLTEEEIDQVLAGNLDFVNNGWIVKW